MNAPILISVYDRLQHLKKCIDSLKLCAESKSSVLFIVSDNSKDPKSEIKIKEVRDYIETITGFKKVISIYNEKNLGSTNSVKNAREIIFKKYDKLIFLEDDVIVSPLFLKYINQGLNYYNNNDNIFSICGFSLNILEKDYKYTKSQVLFSNQWSAWGYGCWRDKFNNYLNYRYSEQQFIDLKKDLKSRSFIINLNKMSIEHYPHLLYSYKKNKLPAFDYNVDYYCLKNSLLNVYNSNTFTLNNGNDGSGEHAKKNDTLMKIMKLDYSKEIPILNNNINLKYFKNYTPNNKLILLKLFLIKVGLFDQGKRIFNLFNN